MKQRRRPPHRCCIVWVATTSGLMRGCIHCHRIVDRIPSFVGGSDLLIHLADQSVAGHSRVCPIPVRQATG